MLSFIYNIIEAILSLVLRFWRSPLKVEGVNLELITESDDKKVPAPCYRCQMTIINKARDAIYTEKIALIINDDIIYHIRDGSDRFRIDTEKPMRVELIYPIEDEGKVIREGRFCIDLKPMSGKNVKTHGCFPIDYSSVET
jgi:hypothetical protein